MSDIGTPDGEHHQSHQGEEPKVRKVVVEVHFLRSFEWLPESDVFADRVGRPSSATKVGRLTAKTKTNRSTPTSRKSTGFWA
jgi:hypothetical protein